MQIPRYQSNKKLGFNMTPMIDVVFLLIIFFLVSSHLSRQENQVELRLPIATSADDDPNAQTPRLTINVSAAGDYSLAGRAIAADGLKKRFIELVATQGDDLEVRIRGSRLAPYGAVEPIMLACTESGIWNVTYAVYREPQP
jgi:biopolymer transport protein ExbD